MKTIYFIIIVLLITLDVKVGIDDSSDGCYELRAVGTHINNTCFDDRRN